MKKLIEIFKQHFGHEPQRCTPLAKAGSNRQYFRMYANEGKSVIGVIGQSVAENRTFIYLSRHFSNKGLPVPHIFEVSTDEMCFLQTDLGQRALYDALKEARNNDFNYTHQHIQLIERTLRLLPHIQVRGAEGLDFSRCGQPTHFNKESAMFDFNYFKYCFLRTTEIPHDEVRLEHDMQHMAADLAHGENSYFQYRDFQARNVMLSDSDEPYFIDFQGGRKGPFYYDLASFLWQASAKYSYKLRRNLVAEYYDALKQYIEVPNTRHFVARLTLFVLFRTLQVLGAYGFRGYFEHKQHFIDSIPPAMDNLRDLLKLRADILPYPYLHDVLTRLTELPQFAHKETPVLPRTDGFRTTDNSIYPHHPMDGLPTFSKYDGKGPLVVDVYSFSYRKGIPEDPSGNGGGYVFDCRSTHNPGRYEPYKKQTGLDEPVIRFLEDDGEILEFLDHVYALADKHVARYIQRGFTHLMFCFGCTGGQHRSVYSAQHLAEHLHDKFGIEVRINHREQNIQQVLPAVERNKA